MMSIWMVKPEEVKIDLQYESAGTSYPFWIKIKKFLTVGEERRIMTAGWRGVNSGAPKGAGEEASGTEIKIDWRAQTFARTEIYLTGWSLTGDNDKVLPFSRDVLENLKPDVYALVENAITAHLEAVVQEKKATDGVAAPRAMSA